MMRGSSGHAVLSLAASCPNGAPCCRACDSANVPTDTLCTVWLLLDSKLRCPKACDKPLS